MIDSDLAALYEVATKRLNEQVKRNTSRFPNDFMFMLTEEECGALRSQIATSKIGSGGRRYLPIVFTEQGIAMLSSVLTSERAVQVNVLIMRTFVKLREVLSSHRELALQVEALEEKYSKHDHQFKIVFNAIKALIADHEVPRKKVTGLRSKDE